MHAGGVLLLLALVTGGVWRGYLPFFYVPRYTPHTMSTVTPQSTIHCIGRYLITLPSDFELRSGGWGDIEMYYGLDKNFQRVYATVKQGRYTSEGFWKEMNERRVLLKGTTNDTIHGSMLLHEEQIDKFSALLRRLPDEESAGSIKTELHVLVGDRYVTLEQQSYDLTAEPLHRHMDYKNADPTPAEARLKTIASKLLPYKNAERAKPGFCMQGVLFSDTGQDDESAIFNFRAKTLPDVFVDVDYHAVTGQPKFGLLQRKKDAYVDDPKLLTGLATLRERPMQLGGDPAEEALSRTTQSPIQHIFGIERRDKLRRTLDRPFFGVHLTTGNEYRVHIPPGQAPPRDNGVHWSYSPKDQDAIHDADDASLSDEEVLKLWDDTVASVRKR
ncbi:hypothetical protein BH11PSE13_BH11PSE13_24290 [soil metagenome]